MSAVQRNYMWVSNEAFNIARSKTGIAKGMFTAGEVVESLGFSRNTVNKYLKEMEEAEIIYRVVISPSVIIWRFNEADNVDTREVQDIPF